MLVLTRKNGERIRIGDDIWVSVEKGPNNRIKVSIDAPPEVRILREELIAKNNPTNEVLF